MNYTQTIRRLLLTNCLSVFDHFVRLALKRLNMVREVLQKKMFLPLFYVNL